MSSVLPSVQQTKLCHVVAVPYPGRSVINTMLNICTAIAQRNKNILITIILTQEWRNLIISNIKKLPNIQFATIPNVLPSELVRGNDLTGFMNAVSTHMRMHVEGLLDRLLRLFPAVIMADTLPWMADVANRRRLQFIHIWPQSASMLSLMCHFDLLVQKGHCSIDNHTSTVNQDGIVDYIPGLPPIRVSDLPKPTIQKYIPSVKYLLISSLNAIEAQVIVALQQTTNTSIYNIGPIVSYSKMRDIKSNTLSNYDNLGSDQYMKWLDLQPPRSVLYISFGSFLPVHRAQMVEIYAGLYQSGVRFLWVERNGIMKLSESILGKKGLVVRWCDQLRVLCHESVGGYWNHCGWNSTKEGLLSGVPILTFPMIMDQQLNAKAIVEDWKVGWRVKSDFGGTDIVKRDQIGEIVTRFMNLESEERVEVEKKCREMQMICEKEGLVVRWCDQLRVLCHESVGGYWNHCGWNSTKEGLLSGVPILTFPMIMDQQLNAKAIVEDWKVGWRVKSDFGGTDIVKRDQIGEIVTRFMNLESEERVEVEKKCREMQMICEKEGLVVRWCDQLRVLCHESVGGYWNHCGWNSTKEGLLSGVPILTFPMIMDQQLNAKAIVEDWKVGWRVKSDFGGTDIVKRDQIGEIVTRFMNLESEERVEVEKKCREMQMICEKEFEDGAFEKNVDEFIKFLLQISV